MNYTHPGGGPSFFGGPDFGGSGNDSSAVVYRGDDNEEDAGNSNSGAWGSSSYSDGGESFNSTDNYTTEEFLQMMLGPKQVFQVPSFFIEPNRRLVHNCIQ